MTQRSYVKLVLIMALVFISLGGWLLHLRIHAPSEELPNYLPFITGIAGIIIIPLMFTFHRTVQYAYVINGLIVIIGTILMAHFSISNPPETIGLSTIILKTTLPDIVILWGKFFIGKSLFELDRTKSTMDSPHTGRFLRYPNMGWWIVHLVGLSVVYALGNILWR